MTDTHVTLIVPAAVATKARALAASWPGGVGMWVVPLYTGETVTHYISTGKIDPVVAAMLLAGDAAQIVALIQAQDETAEVTEEQVQALIDAADISTEPGKDAIARLGLSQSNGLMLAI